MQGLARFLFKKHICEETNPLIEALLSLKSVSLTPYTRISQEDLHLFHFLLVKGFVSYSPSALTATLNINLVLFYQRIHKLKNFSSQYYLHQFTTLLDKFIESDLLPIQCSNKILHSLLDESSERKKKGDNRMDYERLIYEYSSHGDSQQVIISIDELSQQMQFFLLEKRLGEERAATLYSQLIHEVQEKDKSKQNEQKKSCPFFIEFYHASKELSGKRVNLIHQARYDYQDKGRLLRLKLLKILLSKSLEGKFQYTQVKQSQSRNDVDKDIESRVSLNCLLCFNALKQAPLASERQLAGITMLSLVDQRKCLDLLVQEGLISFYPEGPRSLVYKVRDFSEMITMATERIATSLSNIHQLAESPHPKQQLLKFEIMLSDLDDALLLLL